MQQENNFGQQTNIPVIDSDEIANILVFSFRKNYKKYDSSNLRSLAFSLNEFGVEKNIGLNYLLRFEKQNISQVEIKSYIEESYRQKSLFRSKFFEDTKTKTTIKNMVVVGKSDAVIFDKFKQFDKSKLKTEIEIIRQTLDVSIFWEYTDKGKIIISPHRFKFFLEANNYFKYYPVEKSKTFTFISKVGNFVDEIYEFAIKDFVLDLLLESDDLRAYDLFATSPRVFTPAFLSLLKTASFSLEQDTPDYAMIYYENIAVRVFSNKIEKINYSDLSGFVWKKQVIERKFIESDHHDSEFRKFIWLASGQNVPKYNALKSVIGYLMHSHKTSANNKAIIFNDETISEDPNGGSGKGIFWNALGYLKKIAMIDAKTFEFNKAFPYQTVGTDSQILVFDDAKKNFDFEKLFSVITEGITLEYKGQDAIKLPVTKSPKILITTNYTISGTGGSFERRKFEIEMSSYFSAKHSPLDEFGHMLFDDWDNDEWLRFDNYMINCLKYYLTNGLVSHEFKNLKTRKFINETGIEFYEWTNEGNIVPNKRLVKSVLFEALKSDFPDLNSNKYYTQKRFTKWLQKYADLKGFKYVDGNSNGQRWCEFESTTDPVPDTQTDIWDSPELTPS